MAKITGLLKFGRRSFLGCLPFAAQCWRQPFQERIDQPPQGPKFPETDTWESIRRLEQVVQQIHAENVLESLNLRPRPRVISALRTD